MNSFLLGSGEGDTDCVNKWRKLFGILLCGVCVKIVSSWAVWLSLNTLTLNVVVCPPNHYRVPLPLHGCDLSNSRYSPLEPIRSSLQYPDMRYCSSWFSLPKLHYVADIREAGHTFLIQLCKLAQGCLRVCLVLNITQLKDIPDNPYGFVYVSNRIMGLKSPIIVYLSGNPCEFITYDRCASPEPKSLALLQSYIYKVSVATTTLLEQVYNCTFIQSGTYLHFGIPVVCIPHWHLSCWMLPAQIHHYILCPMSHWNKSPVHQSVVVILQPAWHLQYGKALCLGVNVCISDGHAS